MFAEDPLDTIKQHVWVTPYYEEDLRHLADTIGVERVLFGSDWPHGEGLAEPASFIDELTDVHARRGAAHHARQLRRAGRSRRRNSEPPRSGVDGAGDPLGDERRLLLALDLDGEVAGDLDRVALELDVRRDARGPGCASRPSPGSRSAPC